MGGCLLILVGFALLGGFGVIDHTGVQLAGLVVLVIGFCWPDEKEKS